MSNDTAQTRDGAENGAGERTGVAYALRTPRVYERGELYLIRAFGRIWVWPKAVHAVRRKELGL